MSTTPVTRVHQPTRAQAAAWELTAFLRHLDYLLLAATGGLLVYGLWVLESVTKNDVPGDPGYYAFRQTIYVAVGAVLLVAAAVVDPNAYRRVRWPLYGTALVLLIAVFVLAEEVRGSKRWIQLGFFNFQPSELGKIVLVIVLAAFVAERRHRLAEWGTTLGVIGLSVPLMALVFKEPDFGTTLIYAAVVFGALFFGGTPWRHLAVLAIVAGLAAGALLWFLPSAGIEVLEPYQRERLVGFVDPDIDPSGSTYNVNQSITAVGAGGFDGRGEDNATQTKFNYLPEHSTDFIFSSLAEQRGFLGAAILLLIYAVVIWRGTKIVSVAKDLYSAVLAGTIVFALLIQLFINVGMTIGIAPVTGIPLPLVSYGGSSLLTTLIFIGLLEAVHVRGR
ncbi:MAG TPA: rod shape-determining protein RodA, partial [Gaiellaceae bacterium]|nr:rod shape-determining protein RodA [Gaiellaceae bacterium]